MPAVAPATAPDGAAPPPATAPRSQRTASSAAMASWPSWRRHRGAAGRDDRGAGGSGKTRLALELADRGGARGGPCSSSWPRSPHQRMSCPAAAALGLQAAPGGLEGAVAERLNGRHLTLVVDNCEHVIAGVVALVGVALAASPGVPCWPRLQGPARRGRRAGRAPRTARRWDQAELFADRRPSSGPGFDPVRRITGSSGRSAATSTACRWRSSSPHGARRSSAWRSWPTSSPAAST